MLRLLSQDQEALILSALSWMYSEGAMSKDDVANALTLVRKFEPESWLARELENDGKEEVWPGLAPDKVERPMRPPSPIAEYQLDMSQEDLDRCKTLAASLLHKRKEFIQANAMMPRTARAHPKTIEKMSQFYGGKEKTAMFKLYGITFLPDARSEEWTISNITNLEPGEVWKTIVKPIVERSRFDIRGRGLLIGIDKPKQEVQIGDTVENQGGERFVVLAVEYSGSAIGLNVRPV